MITTKDTVDGGTLNAGAIVQMAKEEDMMGHSYIDGDAGESFQREL